MWILGRPQKSKVCDGLGGCIDFREAREKWSMRKLPCSQLISGSLNYLVGAVTEIKSGLIIILIINFEILNNRPAAKK